MPTREIATSDLFGGGKHSDAPGATDIVSTPGEVMLLHVATGYRRDERNRLVAINDWVQRPVPRLWLGRTRDSVIWLFRHDLPDHICDELESVCCREIPCDGGAGSVAFDKYQAILDRHGLSASPWRGPVYWFSTRFKARRTFMNSPGKVGRRLFKRWV